MFLLYGNSSHVNFEIENFEFVYNFKNRKLSMLYDNNIYLKFYNKILQCFRSIFFETSFMIMFLNTLNILKTLRNFLSLYLLMI